jgi:predicted Zn-dependent protease
MATLQEQYDDAMFAFSQANYDDAITKLNSILSEDPANFEAQLALGMSYYRLENYAQAIAEGHKAEALKPKEQLVHTNLSLFYMKSGDKLTAEKHGLKAKVAAWGSDMKTPGETAETDSELKIAQPEAKPISVTGKKFPDMPWKKNKKIN